MEVVEGWKGETPEGWKGSLLSTKQDGRPLIRMYSFNCVLVIRLKW